MASIHPNKSSLKDRVIEHNDSIEIVKRIEMDDLNTNKLDNLESIQSINKKKDLKRAKERT